jgi:hypothetical protein
MPHTPRPATDAEIEATESFPDDAMFAVWIDWIRSKESPDYFERFKQLASDQSRAIRFFVCKLFANPKRDPKNVTWQDTWEQFTEWLEFEHGLAGDELLATKASDVVTLLESEYHRRRGNPKASAKKPLKRGRPRRKQERKLRQLKLAANWKCFYDSKAWRENDGTPKAQFCRSEGIELEELETALRACRGK